MIQTTSRYNITLIIIKRQRKNTLLYIYTNIRVNNINAKPLKRVYLIVFSVYVFMKYQYIEKFHKHLIK